MNEPPQYPAGNGPQHLQPDSSIDKVTRIMRVSVGVFGLLVCLSLGVLIYPVVRGVREAFKGESSGMEQRAYNMSILDAVAKGCQYYAKDHKNQLPDLSSIASLAKQLKPYSRDAHVMSFAMSRQPPALNSKLSKADMKTLGHPDQMILAYVSWNPDIDARQVVFADGQLGEISESDFQADLKK